MRQPDIEIYLKDADVDHKQIAEWLAQAIGPCTEWKQKGHTFKCQAGNIPVTWLPKAVGKWNSLYLKATRRRGPMTLPAPAPHLPRWVWKCAARRVAGSRKTGKKMLTAGSASAPTVKRKSPGVHHETAGLLVSVGMGLPANTGYARGSHRGGCFAGKPAPTA